MKILDYKLVNDISCLFKKNIFVYGTGVYGSKVTAVFTELNIEIYGFCETNPINNVFSKKKVISAENLIRNYDTSDILVIIASEKYYKEMFYELQTTKNMSICTYYALFLSLYLNYETEGITENLKRNIKFYKALSLEMSIQSFLNSWWTTEIYGNILSQPSRTWLYQPGKVASSTISRSSSLKPYHFHSLACGFNADNRLAATYNHMLFEIKKNPIKIITGVREPISRDISAFFQGSDIDIWPLIKYGNNFWFYLFGDYKNNKKLDITTLRKRICAFEKSLNFSFENMSKEIVKNRTDEFSWFDYEIKSLFGIDIYKYPFNKEKGYSIIEKDNVRILVYKCEKLNQLEDVVGEFLEEPGFSITSANQGNEKIYFYVYKEFKEKIKLNKQYFDYYYADNVKLKHFYTDSEIRKFKDKWKKKLQ